MKYLVEQFSKESLSAISVLRDSSTKPHCFCDYTDDRNDERACGIS